jgi:hypothetical protein
VIAVGLVAVLSLLASSMRASDALLGVTFARARAAEAATTNELHARLRIGPEDEHTNDVDALAPPVEIAKASAPPRENEESAGNRVALLAPAAAVMPLAIEGIDTGVRWLPADPPSRARARLMVFLN